MSPEEFLKILVNPNIVKIWNLKILWVPTENAMVRPGLIKVIMSCKDLWKMEFSVHMQIIKVVSEEPKQKFNFYFNHFAHGISIWAYYI
jgi:hypothetical protein